MLRVPLVTCTVLAREMRLKIFKVDQRLVMLRVSLVTVLVREMPLKFFFEVDQALEMLRVPLVTMLAREMRWNTFWRRPSFGDGASAACKDIGARNAIEICFNYYLVSITWLAALEKFLFKVCGINVNFQSHISRQYRDWRSSQHLQVLFKNFQSHFSCQLRDWRHSHPTFS